MSRPSGSRLYTSKASGAKWTVKCSSPESGILLVSVRLVVTSVVTERTEAIWRVSWKQYVGGYCLWGEAWTKKIARKQSKKHLRKEVLWWSGRGEFV